MYIPKSISRFLPSQHNFTFEVNIDRLRCPASLATEEPTRPDVGGATLITSPPQVVSFSTDTIEASFKLKCSDGKIFQRLQEAKKNLQLGTDNSVDFKFLESGSFTWSLSRTGSKFYSYILRRGDVIMQLHARSPESTIPNCSLHVGSISCHSNPIQIYKDWKRTMEFIGFTFVYEKVSRCDICADVAVSITDLDIYNDNKRICRSTNVDIKSQDYKKTGIVIAPGGDIHFRAYGKDREMIKKQATEKIEFFYDLWSIPVLTPVTRFEFQLRGDAIKEIFGKDCCTIEEIIYSIGPAWEYLTIDWLRFTEREFDRKNKNHSRAETSIFWKMIQDIPDTNYKARRVKKVKHINVAALKKQMLGIMTSIIAAYGHCAEDFFGMMATARQIIDDGLPDVLLASEFFSKFRNKQALAVVDF